MADRTRIAITLVVGVIVILVGYHIIATVAAGSDFRQYAAEADAYCEQELGENATLVNSRVIGSHGGLHFEGPDGEVIHLHEVPREDLRDALLNRTRHQTP